MPIRDALTDIGITPDTAEALMTTHALAGTPLDLDAAMRLADELDGPDPEASALDRLGNGLGNRRTRRRRNAQPESSPPMVATRRVNRELEPDLWARCCARSGHTPDLTGKDGSWAFPADVVAEAEQGLGRIEA